LTQEGLKDHRQIAPPIPNSLVTEFATGLSTTLISGKGNTHRVEFGHVKRFVLSIDKERLN
jgi:hypothetical protein